MEQEQQNKENIHFFNYWEARDKDHKIPHQKFITQTNDFLEDAKNNALSLHYITRMKKLLYSCKRNVTTIHKERFSEKDIEIKCQIMSLQQAIIEAQMEIESLQIDLHLHKKKHETEKQEIKNYFQEIKNFQI